MRRFLALILTAAAAAYVFALPRVRERLNYPVRYEPQIRAYAGAYSLDPALVAALVQVESGGNARAVSGVGAMGLMQIMPDTGRWISRKLGAKGGFQPEALFDADTALLYGCWYLSYLFGLFGGETTCAVAAYHAGQGAVRGWLSDSAYSSDGRTLSAFPDDAPRTRNYVSKVKKAYEYYQKAYK